MNIMAIIALVSAIVGGVYGLIQFLQLPLFKKKQIRINIEIVLDRSAGMHDNFDGKTKWDAAVSAVEQSLQLQVAKKDNLALRQFGSPCEGENTQLVVEFSQHNEGKVRKALRNMSLEGDTTLASAVIEAAGDFNDPERFEGVSKTIIVITGSGDGCYSDAVNFVADRLQDKIDSKENIKVHFSTLR